MKTFALFLLLSIAAPVIAQNCSTATMQFTTEDNLGCAPKDPPPYNPGYIAPVELTWTYQDKCTNTNVGQGVYYNNQSKVAGNGQCYSNGYNPNLTWKYCYGSNQTQ